MRPYVLETSIGSFLTDYDSFAFVNSYSVSFSLFLLVKKYAIDPAMIAPQNNPNKNLFMIITPFLPVDHLVYFLTRAWPLFYKSVNRSLFNKSV